MVSFKCITYARVPLLEEALYSFLLLDDNDSELIIVNDYPLQKLIFNHPKVKIYNLDYTFPLIGEKENFAIEKCSGDIIGVFDDDDICMPHHLNNIKEWFKEGTNILHWARGVYYNTPNIASVGWLGNSGIVYSRNAWELIGRSPLENAGGDTTLSEKMYALDTSKRVLATPSIPSWWYRWQLPQCYHQSGNGHDVEGKPNIIQRHTKFIESERKAGRIKTGDIHLSPHYNLDYPEMLKNYLKLNKNA